MKIPFKLLPGSWGLKGKTFERAKAEYELEGDALDIRLAEIEHGADSVEVKRAKLKADKNAKKITDREFEKQNATLTNEPWVTVIKMTVDKKNPNNLGEVELDWNEAFITELRKNGYNGATDYAIVDAWFTMVCAAVANETGLVDATDKLFKRPDDGEVLPPVDPNFREYS